MDQDRGTWNILRIRHRCIDRHNCWNCHRCRTVPFVLGSQPFQGAATTAGVALSGTVEVREVASTSHFIDAEVFGAWIEIFAEFRITRLTVSANTPVAFSIVWRSSTDPAIVAGYGVIFIGRMRAIAIAIANISGTSVAVVGASRTRAGFPVCLIIRASRIAFLTFVRRLLLFVIVTKLCQSGRYPH